MSHRIGYGEDSHRLVRGKKLIVGGVQLESDRGSDAHSDGDVLLHALSDALLSAFSLGDIGAIFPPGNPETRGLDSQVILNEVLKSVPEGWRIGNIAATLTLDFPKLGARRCDIQEHVAGLLDIPAGDVGLTLKTSEGLAPEHVQCRVSVLLVQEG